ncbi:MAG TPA: hypothetical protein VGF67_27900 [Ktedonobacteraceae bacterium]|jgi:hypothetical protein
MNNGVDGNPPLPERFAEVFARLPEQEIEQFYARYQLWLLRRRVPILQKQIETLDEHLAENQQVMQSLQPAAIALAVLARLQASGVSNVELLDQLLARGEGWLDRMMQRLDYCEQVQDFIQGDYTQWCYRSLDGAYDWIDTLLGSANGREEPRPSVEETTEATEELLLQRLRQDDEEEVLAAALTLPARVDEDQDKASDPPAQAEEIPPDAAVSPLTETPALVEEASETHPALEQASELVDWADLDAPDERPAPWYGVGLADEASGESAPQDEMNEWIKVLQEEGNPQVETTATEDAQALPTGVEAGQSAEDEVALSTTGGRQAQTPAVAEAALEDEPRETLAEKHVGAEILESVAIAQAPEERTCEESEAAGMAEEDSKPAEASEILLEEPGPEEVLPVGKAEEAGEQEVVVGPEVDGDELSDDALADSQEERERRPWYEYLSQDESGETQDPRAVGEYREPEATALAALATPLEEETVRASQDQEDEQPADPDSQDDATRPMALKDIRPAQTGPGTEAASEIAPLPAVVGVSASMESEGEVQPHALAVSEIALAGSTGEPAQPRMPQVVYKPWPQSVAVPQKRGFWRRLFGWLRAGR